MRLIQPIALAGRLLCAALVCVVFSGTAPAQQRASVPSQQPASVTYENLKILASRLLQYSDSADCHKGSCKLLVADFRLPDNHGSLYGRQLADDLAAEFRNQMAEIQVIDRALLQAYLDKERIPSDRLNEGGSRAVASYLGATTVLVGTTRRLDDYIVELSARMLSVSDKDHIGQSAEVKLQTPLVIIADLSSSEPYLPLPAFATQDSRGEVVYRLGAKGTTLPSCTYMPNPLYSEAARKLRVEGSLMIEAIVTTEGKLEDLRIVRGLPGGLNENALATLKTWRCSPAMKDQNPVPVVVPFEVNFRLY